MKLRWPIPLPIVHTNQTPSDYRSSLSSLPPPAGCWLTAAGARWRIVPIRTPLDLYTPVYTLTTEKSINLPKTSHHHHTRLPLFFFFQILFHF